ncbi:DMT family transporter [Halobacillus locisalis]|uniref:DMT family transporter n=1 Tax=Halobacillus locisalis TaxID=220753 RepID=A0A838CWY7_9BACI|nr:DMT family transporter [Halobacillus locisalis]MBA2176433.1 DMT family transporter [Halobacillus locisalis]
MLGIVLSIVAGVLISTQNVFNTRISEKGGAWATTTIVLGIGLVVSIPVFFIMDDTHLLALGGVNPIYLLGGVFGVGIVYGLMRGMTLLGPAYAVSIVMVSQLVMASVINTFGLFNFEAMAFTLQKGIGLALLIVGVLVFKLGGKVNVSGKVKKINEKRTLYDV